MTINEELARLANELYFAIDYSGAELKLLSAKLNALAESTVAVPDAAQGAVIAWRYRHGPNAQDWNKGSPPEQAVNGGYPYQCAVDATLPAEARTTIADRSDWVCPETYALTLQAVAVEAAAKDAAIKALAEMRERLAAPTEAMLDAMARACGGCTFGYYDRESNTYQTDRWMALEIYKAMLDALDGES